VTSLGKVRTEVVKRVSRELMSRFPNAFGPDYEDNKRKIEEFIEVDGKRLRNRIAGYITHLKKIETKEMPPISEVET
jgi:small subunit ribosomal protein S17e